MSSSETDMDTNHLRITDEELQADLDALQAEALGWLPLGDGAYLHAGGLAATRDDARADVFNYIEMFYNSQSRHSSAAGLSPVEFEQRHSQRLKSV